MPFYSSSGRCIFCPTLQCHGFLKTRRVEPIMQGRARNNVAATQSLARSAHGGFPRLRPRSQLCYELIGRTGPARFHLVTPGISAYSVCLFCLFEPVVTQAVDVRRYRQAGTTQRGDSLHGLFRAGFVRFCTAGRWSIMPLLTLPITISTPGNGPRSRSMCRIEPWRVSRHHLTT
jgi:hypothetical protein